MTKRKIIFGVSLTIIVFLCLGLLFKTFVLDNPDNLFFAMEATGNQSKIYRFAIKRIYLKVEKTKLGLTLVERLRKGQNRNLHYHYIRILGIAGITEAIPFLEAYIDTSIQDIPSKKQLVMVSASSLGAIGDDSVVPFLESRLGQFAESLQNTMIAFALYLLNGKKYEYINFYDVKEVYVPTQRNKETQQLIFELRGKKRKYRDMVILDRLLHPTKSEYLKGKRAE